ncbi:MAG TPA: sigma-70 family RNA polymerase sigma factor [Vicinamibacterales bacterium]|nr:sigma-70 family RNA polymerase sigma factor [Vicinamibacterales bacterium]
MAQDSPEPSAEITQLLRDWQGGSREALDRLIPLVYDELHVIAARHLAGEQKNRSLQTTALVNEAYLKLIDQQRVDWQNRAHFFAIAARLMRRILIDDARRRLREKRGGSMAHVSVEEIVVAQPDAPVDVVDLLQLDRALLELERLDPDQAQIVELRFFAGLTLEETATVVGSSLATVKREWAVAKGWLHRELTRSGERPSTS